MAQHGGWWLRSWHDLLRELLILGVLVWMGWRRRRTVAIPALVLGIVAQHVVQLAGFPGFLRPAEAQGVAVVLLLLGLVFAAPEVVSAGVYSYVSKARGLQRGLSLLGPMLAHVGLRAATEEVAKVVAAVAFAIPVMIVLAADGGRAAAAVACRSSVSAPTRRPPPVLSPV